MTYSPDAGEFIDTVDIKLLPNIKNKNISLTEKIVEKNKKFLEKYNEKTNLICNDVCALKTKNLNNKLIYQANKICRMFDSMYRNGVKKPKIEEISILPSKRSKKSKCSGGKKLYVTLNKITRRRNNLKDVNRVSTSTNQSKGARTNFKIMNNVGKCAKLSLPRDKYFYTVDNKKKYSQNESLLMRTSITTWNQLTTAYIILFFYLYLILEIRNALDPIVYYV